MPENPGGQQKPVVTFDTWSYEGSALQQVWSEGAWDHDRFLDLFCQEISPVEKQQVFGKLCVEHLEKRFKEAEAETHKATMALVRRQSEEHTAVENIIIAQVEVMDTRLKDQNNTLSIVAGLGVGSSIVLVGLVGYLFLRLKKLERRFLRSQEIRNSNAKFEKFIGPRQPANSALVTGDGTSS
jgi:hypothetical protein